MNKYYCEYCGRSYPTENDLMTNHCINHPSGINKGMHKLYGGGEKIQYNCKYCNKSFPTLHALISGYCNKHPEGPSRGAHSPVK